ncbi:signal transduction histidine kinase [Streptomyces sp. 1114.5]|uniref:sensor histidine kinase n=1 Tax=Streptomyces sp. 1114.5 TaxID=1938830 RepID=UPI000F0EDAB0|nr:histidine kinase [Streptomyces sp. 1114.5]RKT17845.1 signal transduction histidine kinase [Streptomyces sp. 1114.5]
MTTASRASGTSVRAQTQAAFAAGGQGLARLVVLVVSAVPGFVLPVMAAVISGVITARLLQQSGPGLLLALLVAAAVGAVVAAANVHRTANRTRGQLARWFGARLPASYEPQPGLELDGRGHWWTGYSYHRSRTVAKYAQLAHWGLRDRTTRAELAWLAVTPFLTLALAGPVLGLLGLGTAYALSGPVPPSEGFGPLSGQMVSALLGVAFGAAMIVAGILVAPFAVRAYAEVARRVLDQDGRATHAQLTRRVAELTETRADAAGNQAAELRRIERDLHDGAQARLVAIGMTLGTIEHLLDTDQAAARELLAEARQSSARALQELRDLVRGIHPPVLAERGLGDAVRALALDCALPTEVVVSLPDRPPAPVEAAVYFSICELLANAAKHSEAEQVWVDILYRAGFLRVTVTDDGVGVADPSRGTGLRGIEKRLGTFDGVLAIDSTSGGPTTITLELPCELSSPRTSTSFAKA